MLTNPIYWDALQYLEDREALQSDSLYQTGELWPSSDTAPVQNARWLDDQTWLAICLSQAKQVDE